MYDMCVYIYIYIVLVMVVFCVSSMRRGHAKSSLSRPNVAHTNIPKTKIL